MKNLQLLDKRISLLEDELIGHLIINPSSVSSLNITEKLLYRQKELSIILDTVKNGKNLANELTISNLYRNDYEVYTSRDVKEIAKEVVKALTTRKIIGLLEKASLELDVNNVNEKILEVQSGLLSTGIKEEEKSTIGLIDEFRALQDVYTEKFKNGNKIIGISTGYDKVDDVIDGFRAGHFWVIGGYTSMGKTQATLNLASNLIKQGKRVVIYSIEMSRIDIISRLSGIMTGQSGLSIIKNFSHNKEKVSEAFKQMVDSNFVVINGKTEISEIEFSMYEENHKQKVDLFIIDFIQLVTMKGTKSEYETTTQAVISLQQMAQRLKTTVIGLSQISNEGAKTSNDFVMSFKGSGAIGAAADFAIELIHADKDKSVIMNRIQNGQPLRLKWMIRKNRHGRSGYIEMYFDQKTGIFTNGDFQKDDTNYFNE